MSETRTRSFKATLKERLAPLFRSMANDVVLPMVYRASSLQPVDPKKSVFIEVNRPDGVSDSMALVWDQLRERGFSCEFISLGKQRLSRLQYLQNCIHMAHAVATARLVFICEGFAPLGMLKLRNETKVIQLWHGCGAFKKFGMSTAEKLFGASREVKLRYPEHRSTSLVTVSSPEVVWAYVEAMCMESRPQVVQPLGVSRTDVFFDETFVSGKRAEVEAMVPQAEGKRVLLYAPTFRGRVATATTPDQLDVRLLKKRLGKDYILLLKHHPHVKVLPRIPDECSDFAFDVTRDLSIEACLCRADVCVTDYSSLVFEYSLFGRPMAFFAFDLADYDDWRGFYYDYEELTPGPIVTTTEAICDYIEHLDERFDQGEVEAFRERFMSSCDGQATRRIIDAALALE